MPFIEIICISIVWYQYNYIQIDNWNITDWNYLQLIIRGITDVFVNEITVNQIGLIGLF